MKTKNTVFEKTYCDYLNQIGACDLNRVACRYGLSLTDGELIVPLLEESYSVSGQGISNEQGQKPGFECCIILSKYILMCPEVLPEKYGWTAFRDLKNAGPLEKYFRHDVEGSITRFFEGKTPLLEKAVNRLGGTAPGMALNYDLSSKVVLLPKLPVIITFNDADDDFSVNCSVLFEHHAESILDAESLAILGHLFAEKLKILAVE